LCLARHHAVRTLAAVQPPFLGSYIRRIRRNFQARRYLANRYRREALAQCAVLEASLDREDARARALAELAVLLERTALSAWPRPEVAALSGPAWIAFLRDHGPRAGIDAPLERLLHDTEYQPGSLATFSRQDAQACARAVRHWIEAHRVSP
jgi:hypothetical protein